MNNMHFKHIHFVGIGGIGMSGIAQLARKKNIYVSGCDTNITPSIHTLLLSNGIVAEHTHNSGICCSEDIDLYVISSAIKQTIAELQYAQLKRIPIMHRAEFLAMLMKNKDGIAIAGTHGKTTTTSLITQIFIDAQMEPTAYIGGVLPQINNSIYSGNGTVFIAEADESDRSFLAIPSQSKIITTIDYEHPETYTNIEDLYNAFLTFIKQAETKTIYIADSNPLIHNILNTINSSKKVVIYGIVSDAHIYATNIRFYPTKTNFLLQTPLYKDIPITTRLIGKHNLYNVLAAIAIALDYHIKPHTLQASLEAFIPPLRRFTIRGKTTSGTTIIDDYAHHPAELQALIEAASIYSQGKSITLIFQPHRYARTAQFWHYYLQVLMTNRLQAVYITNLYAAGEIPIQGISSEILALQLASLRNNLKTAFIKKEDIPKLIYEQKSDQDVVIFASAGNLYDISLHIIK